MITPAQCRAARAWLEMTQAELGAAIGRSDAIVRRFELGLATDQMLAMALQQALEQRKIRFLNLAYDHRFGITGPDQIDDQPPKS